MREKNRLNSSRRNSYKKVSKIDAEHLVRFVFDEGLKVSEAARRLSLSYNNATKIIKRKRFEQATIIVPNETIIHNPGRSRLLTDSVLQNIEFIIEKNNCYTLKEIKEKLANRFGVVLSKSTIDNGLKQLKITLKKSSILLDRVNSAESLENRRQYASLFTNESPNDKGLCVFIDESGFNYHMIRGQARSQRGTRASVQVPTIRGRMQTLILAASQRGVIHYKLISNNTCNGQEFLTFINELISILNTNESMRGAWLIMDNARIHGIQEIRNLIAHSAFRLVFLSPYSYMLNPVEQIFSKIKASVRSQLTLNFSENFELNMINVIHDAVATVTITDCNNYVIHMMRNISLALEKHLFK